jgi:hypothetical protein
MLNSLDPLPFRNAAITGNPEIDEIVVSAFSVQIIDNSPTGDIDINARAGSSIYPTGYQAVVVGRYPFNANECTIAPDGSLTSIERDPFDYIPNTAVDDLGAPDFEPIELPGLDVGLEPQRGFVWFGQHQVSNPNVNCLGSEFSIADVEGLMNVPTFGLADDEERSQLPPGQGIVLVEMFWEHDLLLDFPVFSPVFNVLGENPSISVWAAFPVPSIEPKIRFS